MGRAPCCDKANVKKGPWSPEEDAKLKSYIEQHGTGGNWIALPQKIGLKRCGKSCRLRWLNYLRPNIKHGGFSEEEDNLICSLYISIGSRWSIIAAQLPGRTDNDIKNYWNTRLKKKLLGKHRKDHHHNYLRRGKGIKTEDKNANPMMIPQDTNINQSHPYWPDLPAAPTNTVYSNQEPRFNDHASIRKLLIKLGGRFSGGDDNNDHDKTLVGEDGGGVMNVQFPVDVSPQPPLYDELGTADQHQFGGFQFQMLQQGQSSNYQLDGMEGLEFLYGDDHMNGSRIAVGSLGGENMRGWSEMGSPVITPSSYEATVGMIQEVSFGDGLRYSPVAPAGGSGGRI